MRCFAHWGACLSKLTSTVRAEAVKPVKGGVAVLTIHTLSRTPSEHDIRSVLLPSCSRFTIAVQNQPHLFSEFNENELQGPILIGVAGRRPRPLHGAPTILGLAPTEFYGALATILIIITAEAFLAFRQTRKGPNRTRS